MNWLTIILMAAILFFNRYVFFAPSIPVRLPTIIQDALKYSAPCILTAICGPILLLNDDGGLRSFPDNPYLWGVLFSILVARYVRNMIVAVLVSMAFFYMLLYLMA